MNFKNWLIQEKFKSNQKNTMNSPVANRTRSSGHNSDFVDRVPDDPIYRLGDIAVNSVGQGMLRALYGPEDQDYTNSPGEIIPRRKPEQKDRDEIITKIKIKPGEGPKEIIARLFKQADRDVAEPEKYYLHKDKYDEIDGPHIDEEAKIAYVVRRYKIKNRF